MNVIGIDPGAGGGLAWIEGAPESAMAYKFTTKGDMRDTLRMILAVSKPFAMLEKVHSMPKQGISSTFKFGANYGFWEGLLLGLLVPYEEVSPQRWQKAMGCLTHGDKNISKAKAQELFPLIKVTHKIADALLIAEYCRRTHGAK